MIRLEQSSDIAYKAIEKYKPRAVVCMLSGGNDSLTAYYAAKAIGINFDFIIHGNTRTGIKETTNFVREFSEITGERYKEADAGDAYEKYVLRKGFFGRGETAHAFCYHVIKATAFRKAIATIRQRRRNFPVLLINGARKDESKNRGKNLSQSVNIDPAAKNNIWVNIIHDWSKWDCVDFLDQCTAPCNPVTKVLCRSGECMCGTMQSQEQRKEAAMWFPEWGQWLDDLEQRVVDRHYVGWGVHSSITKQIKAGQLFMPMCHSCSSE